MKHGQMFARNKFPSEGESITFYSERMPQGCGVLKINPKYFYGVFSYKRRSEELKTYYKNDVIIYFVI
ncbi:hypothetical protein EIL26_27155 [Salmonella enterica subsp. enterica serovar Newport]|uniref:Uncharacterized protein n=1 Tax=Salmonella newport TaxID=108619 RepID=A0A5X8XZZ8_SALNE|nr:hypothetical protein [Salmonella enterica]EBS4088321.1 hypothetical protein [Salmonella enterica subsp. enterica serovar Newport]EBV1275543.1 hypothetical protein [Salmonella enterica subsp. enterica serovar Oranienburg]EBW9463269.1 hypothetical protein [Salmonella enterica subsp. enterica serovar Panama]EBL6729705.1 hypothetical protein [Salmonella enterica]